MVEDIQYGGGISSIRWKIFSTDVSHSMEEVNHQYSGGHAVWTCYIINAEEGVLQYMATKLLKGSWWLYLSGKMIFYRQYNPDFILPR